MIAQQPKRVRRIGMLRTLTADDPEGRARLALFVQGLEEAGWFLANDGTPFHHSNAEVRQC